MESKRSFIVDPFDMTLYSINIVNPIIPAFAKFFGKYISRQMYKQPTIKKPGWKPRPIMRPLIEKPVKAENIL